MAQGWKRDYTRYKSFFLNVLSAYNTKPNLKIYLELLLSLGTVVVFSIFAIKPTIITILEINSEIKAKEDIIAKLDKKLTDLQSASNTLQNGAQNLKFIEEAVPSSSELEKLISQIESLALSNSIQISSITSSDLLLKGVLEKTKKVNDLSPLSDGANELNISFSATGEYQNLLTFLQSVENLRRPVKFDTFIFNSTKSTSESQILTLTVAGRVPFLIYEKQ